MTEQVRRFVARPIRLAALVGMLGSLAPTVRGDTLNHVISPARARALAADASCPLDGAQRDEGSIVVIEHDGSDYSWKLPDGTSNYEPRTCVSRRFYRNHSDAYDFVVVFTNFEFETGVASAFHNLVRNEVRGIGKPVMDNGSFFGSPGRLKGYIDMAAVSRWVPPSGEFAPGDPAFATALHVLAHEVGHQWLAEIRYRDASGTSSPDLLGRDGAHWSYLLDSDASHLYGSDWVSFESGRYRAERIRESYSALDLYLMGLLPADRTPPFTLLHAPGVDPTQLPLEGAEVQGAAETVRVEDVIAAETPRDPDALSSQKEFRLGFVMLVRPGTQPTPLEMQAVERLRDAFQAYFFAQTRGVAVADTTLAEAPPPPPLPEVDLEGALAWLLAHQGFDGRWEDMPGTDVRDSSLAIEALSQLGQVGEPYERGMTWLGAARPRNADFMARRILALSGRPLSDAQRAELLQALLACQAPAGGFGPAPGYAATALDTALALGALRALGRQSDDLIAGSFAALASLETPGGGWGVVSGGRVSMLVTAEVLQGLLDWPEIAAGQALLPRTLQALTARRNADGGFGESPSTPYATAVALRALARAGLPAAQMVPPIGWLKAAQHADGSWNGSRYETALALGALRVVLGANLTVPADSLVLDPLAAHEGQTVQVTAVVKNVGRSLAAATHARLYDGSPATGELIAEVLVPALDPGQQAPVAFEFATMDHAGSRVLYVVADGRNEQEEAREDDNTASRAIAVEGRLPDLEMALGAIQVAPDPPIEGETAQVSVVVRNRGERRSPAGAVLRLVLGNPRLGGRVIGDAPIPPIEPGASAIVSLTWDTTGALGQHLLYGIADATYAVTESDESNNETAIPIEVTAAPPPGPELELALFAVEPSALSTLPQTLALRIGVKNLGLTAVTSSLAVYESDPPSGPPLFEVPLSLGPRESTTLVQPLTLATPGTRHLLAVADPAGVVPEENENNNRRGAVVVDPQNTVDLELLPGDVVLSSSDLTIGDPLTVTATVRNRGTAPVTAVPVLLSRVPEDGGGELAGGLVDLGPGASAPVALRWTTAATGSPLRLIVRVDPFGVFPELSETNNQVPVSLTVHASARPNLHVSGADVQIAPEPPLQGGSAVVSARVTNPAVVAAGAFRVAIYRGDPGNGGTLIGDQTVPGLAAGEQATVSVTWSPVDVQGMAGLYVVADADAQVDEYDETDNAAFRPLNVVGLADLVLTSADVSLSPPFPHGGETVAVQATVRSLGQRPAGASVLRVVEGEPASGTLVAELPVPAMASGAFVTLSASWSPSGVGERTLALVVDPDGAVAEADEGNNMVRRAVVVQDADLYLTAPYFSPDGDGVLDDTTLAWRASGPVDVMVSNSRGAKVRTLAEQAPAEGALVWDGRDDGGRLLPDGDYAFTLRGQGGVVLKRISATLDTNRLPIHEAAGTGRISVANMTCVLPDLQGPAWMPSEDEALFVRNASDLPEFPPGLLRVGLDGSYAYLFQDPWYSDAARAGDDAVSPNGREVLVVRGNPPTLYAIDLSSGERREVAPASYSNRSPAWSPDGRLIALQDRLVSREGQVVAELQPDLLDYFGTPWAWSPDGQFVAKGNTIVRWDGSDRLTIELSGAVLHTEWRGDGKIYSQLGDCGDGCSATFAFLIEPESGIATPLPWLADREGGVSWSPYGDKVLYPRTKNGEQVSEVAAEDGSQALQLVSRSVTVSPRKSVGYYWEGAQPGSACYGVGGSDLFAVRSLDSLSADFQAARLPGSSGLLLTGVAADRNLESWQLEFSSSAAPDLWYPIGPASDVPVLNDVLTAWVPPAPGTYALRLSVRDLAGNAKSLTRVVAWDRRPSITNITQTEFLISPGNNDGIKDAVRFDYLVQEPTGLDVRIVGPQPTGGGGAPPVVRTFGFEYPEIGARSFVWDGRDAQGQLAADGRYQVLLNEVPLRVDMDNTPPDVAFAFQSLRSEPKAPGQMGELRAERAWHVVDANLKSWTSPVDQGIWPVYDPVRDERGEIVYDNGIPRIRYVDGHAADVVERQDAIDRVGALSGMAFSATDRAGNAAQVPVAPVPEKILLLGAELPDRVLIAPPVAPQGAYELSPQTYFSLAETLGDTPPAREAARFQYQSDFGGPWQESPPFEIDGLSERLDFVGLGLDLAQAYRGRFACDAANGHGEFLSESFRFRPCRNYAKLQFSMLGPPDRMEFRVRAHVTDPLRSADLTLRGEEGGLILHAIMDPDGEGGFVKVLSPETFCKAEAQVQYQNGVIAGDDGLCHQLKVGECGAPPPGDPAAHGEQVRRPCADSDPDHLFLTVSDDFPGFWITVEGDPEGTPFPIAAYVGLGPMRGPKALVADVTGRPHGPLPIRIAISEHPGTPVVFETRLTAFVDRSAPFGEILQPAENAVLCVTRDPLTGVESVPFVVQATDDAPTIEVFAEFRRDSTLPWQPVPRLCPPEGCGDGTISSGEIVPIDWNVTALEDGDYTARITFCDRAGNRTQVERRVSLNRQPPYVRLLDVTRPVFSPNGDGRADSTAIRIRLAEAVALTAEVHAGTATGPLVRTLLSQQSLPAGDHGVVWDGLTDGGATAPDGKYVVAFRARNACGRTGGVNQTVEVDDTPPVVQIAAPQNGSSVTGSADVRGVAADRNLATYELAFSTSDIPWTPFANGTTSQGAAGNPAYLAGWTVPSGEGSAALRLSARDQAENEAQTSVDVTRVPPTRLERLRIFPPLFSPNGDGRRETTALEYSLLATARVVLEVREPGGALVRQLLSGQVQEAGAYALPWNGHRDDGSAAPDAEYVVVVTTEAPAGGGVETAQAAVIVDRTPPSLLVERPAAGAYVDHDASVHGSVQDLRLASFAVSATPAGGAPIELARGNQNQPLSDLAALAALADAPYSLAFDAEDQAENRSRLTVDFVLDSVPPVVAIHQPAPGAVLLKGGTPRAPNGAASDANLREWVLEAGSGADPAYFVEVRRATTGGWGIPLGPWAVAALPDGTYTLRLTAEDRAGHTAEVRSTIDLDGTSPVAAIALPAEGQCLKAPRPITGTANDVHLDAWDLESAPGPAGPAYQWTPVASGSSSVSNGTLTEWNPLPPDGVHTLRLSVRDRVGLSTTALRSVTVDTTPPSTPAGLRAQIVRTGAPQADVVLAWNSIGEPGLAGYRVSRDGQAVGGLVANPTETDPARPEGTYVYEVVAEDLCGNTSAPAVLTVKVDLTPPIVDILRPAEGASVSGTVDIRGTAWSGEDFKEYRLSVGAGGAPTSWTLVRRSALPVLAGPLGTWTALGEGPYTIALEGEDTSGNVARTERHVVVDNLPPQPLLLLSVEVSQQPSWLLSTWQPGLETDVIGYLVYRDGRLANATGIVIGDLRPYLVPPPSYLDKDLPDGQHCYRVVAMDAAGNLSLPSNEICRTLDNRPPHAEIVQPASGTRFEFPVRVVAFTPDTDVARVQFQFKAHAGAAWLDLGAADTQEPWETTLDPQGLAFGQYDLRAVATDAGSRTDPAPASITVIYGDTTAPPPPLDLRARADEDRVYLTWTASTVPDLDGYHVYRDGVRITTAPQSQPAYEEQREPGTYAYTVTAVDADANESQQSHAATALVYQVTLDPLFPVTLTATADLGGGGSRPGLTVDARRDGVAVASTTATGDRFQLPAVPLQPDANVLTAQAHDAQGDRSIVSEELVLIANTAPAALSGLAASVDQHQVTLGWDAAPETDVFGYALRRDGQPLTPTVPQQDVTSITASSTLGANYPALAFDGNPSTAWFPDRSMGAEQSWTITFPGPVLVESVEMDFLDGSYQPTAVHAYRVEAAWEGRFLPLAQAHDNTSATVQHLLPWPFASDTLRIVLTADPNLLQGLAEVRVFKQELVPTGTTTFGETDVPDGYRDYQAAAVDRYGAYGPWASLRVAVGDVEPPAKPTGLSCLAEASDAVLTWNPNPEPDLDHYLLARDGGAIGNTPTPGYRDAALPNGSYRYAVSALDAVGNQSPASDPVDCTIAVAPPVAPVLRAEAVGSGAIRLDWDHPGAPQYALFRSTVAGGPHTELTRTPLRQHLDTTAAYGVRHYYVVRALDAVGNASPVSNEASAVPTRTDPLSAPVILFPTDAAHPTVVETQRTAVRGRSDPGTRVTLRVNGGVVGDVAAQPALTPQGVTSLSGAYGLGVSPDGRYAALLSPAGTELRWLDLASHLEQSFADPGYASLSPLDFAPNATRLLYSAVRYAPSFQQDLFWLDLGDGTTHPVETGVEAGIEARWSPDGSRIAFTTTSNWTDCPLRLFDLGAATTSTLFDEPGCVYGPAWSADGTRLAFSHQTASGQDVRIQDVAGGPAVALGETAASEPDWSPEGTELAFTATSPAPARVRLYDVATGAFTNLTDGSRDATAPRFDPTGRWLSFSEQFEEALGVWRLSILGHERSTGTRRTLASGTGSDTPQLLAWTRNGYAALESAAGELSFLPGFDGAFEFPSVPLEPGANLLLARALDPRSGFESPESAPVSVEVPATLFPDLSVVATEIGSYPAVPLAGQTAALRARVRNLGTVTAREVGVHVLLLDPSGAPSLDTRLTLAELPGGESTLVSLDWSPAQAGSYGLEVRVDEDETIAEAREDNNGATRSLPVVAASGLVVTIDSDRPAYPARTDAWVSVNILNGSAAFAGTARLRVTDAQGTEVALVDQRAVSLAYGQQLAYTARWNTGTTYAGPYAFDLRLSDGAGSPAGTASHSFAIQPEVHLTAALRAAAASVALGAPATFHGRVDNLGVNAPQVGLTARLAILPEGGTNPLFESEPESLPLLLPNASWERDFVWPSAAPAGRYLAELRVTQGSGAPLAVGSTPFEVLSPTITVGGTIAAVPDHVLQGSSFEARFTVTNRGAVALVAYPVVVEVMSGSQATVVASQSLSVDLAPGQTHPDALTFFSTTLAPGPYVLRLRGGTPPATLARASLTVHGAITPPSIDSPPDGATVDIPHPLLVVNNATSTGGATLTYEFQIFPDAGLQLSLPGATGVPETPLRTSWRVTTNLPEDQVYYWRARAGDGFSLSAWSAVASFRVDAQNFPPSAPVPDTPAPGFPVTTRQPALVVQNALDPDYDALTYDYRLALDPEMNMVVASATGLPEGSGLTSWGVPLILDENTSYWWMARAFDGHGFSPWSGPVSFLVDTVDEGPSAPTPLRPIGGARVPTLTPQLVVGNATDPEGQALVYRFELDVVPSFNSPQFQVSPLLAEGWSETDWMAPVPLRDNTPYYWRATASDGHAFGPWASASFFVDLVNEPPGPPVPLDPVDGRAVPTATPTLLVRNAVDPEGDPLTYDFMVSDATGTVAEASGIAPGQIETSWIVAPPLQEDQTYEWRARARDPELPGPWCAPASFRVNAVPAPPTAPGLIAPPEGSTVNARHPALVISNASSPDNQTLTYTFELYAVGAGGVLTLADQVSGLPEGAPSTSWTAGPDLADGAYSWRARAQDAYQSGPWMASAHFTVAVDVPPAPPTGLAAVPGDARVTLTWTASPESDVVGYRVYRSLTAGGPYASIADSAVPTLVDTGVTNGTTYYYVVTARDAQFESGYSNEAAATPQGSSTLPAEVRYTPRSVPGQCLLGCECEDDDESRSRDECDEDARARRKLAPGVEGFEAAVLAALWGQDPAAKSPVAGNAVPPLPRHDDDDDCPRWIKATIELPAGIDPATIDLRTVRLAGSVPADPTYGRLVDSDGDGVPELEVRFAFRQLAPSLHVGQNTLGLSGRAGGMEFTGESTLEVLPLSFALRMSPRTLKRTSKGEEVLARLSLEGCGDSRDIDPASLRLNETVPIERVISWPGQHDVIVKFDRAAVIAVVPPGDLVEVRVSGVVRGLPFVTVDYIRVIP